MAKLLVVSGGVLQTHSVLDHVIIDRAELCPLSTVVLLPEAMNNAENAFSFILLYTHIFVYVPENKIPFHS
jgi:hypothetical protein